MQRGYSNCTAIFGACQFPTLAYCLAASQGYRDNAGIVLESDTDEQLLIQIPFQQGALVLQRPQDAEPHMSISRWQPIGHGSCASQKNARFCLGAAVKLQSIIIASDAGEQAPRRVKLFINKCDRALCAIALADRWTWECLQLAKYGGFVPICWQSVTEGAVDMRRASLGFSEASDFAPTQEFELTEQQLGGEAVQLKCAVSRQHWIFFITNCACNNCTQ